MEVQKQELQIEFSEILNERAAERKEEIKLFFSERIHDVSVVSSIPIVQEKSAMILDDFTLNKKTYEYDENFEQILSSVLSAYGYDEIILISIDNKIAYNVNPNKPVTVGKTHPGISTMENLLSQISLEKVYVSKAYVNNLHENEVEIMFVSPLFQNGTLKGYLGFEWNLNNYFQNGLSETFGTDTGESVIGQKHRDGNIYFLNYLRFSDNLPLQTMVKPNESLAFPMKEALDGKSGSGISVDYRGKEVLASWTYIEILDWGFVQKIDTDEIFASILQLQIFTLTLTFLIIAFSTLSGFFLSNSLITPLKKLEDASKQIIHQNYSEPLTLSGPPEFDSIVDSFNKMKDSINSHLEEIKLSEKKFKTYFDYTPYYVVIVDPDEQIFVDANPKTLKLFDLTLEEFIEKPTSMGVRFESIPNFQKMVEQTKIGNKVEEIHVSFDTKQGIIHLLLTAIPFYDPKRAKTLCVAFGVDVTELFYIQDQLAEKIDELKKIDSQKSEFATMASHELKTPMVPIKGYLEMLLEPDLIGNLTSAQKEIVEKIYSNAEILETLILKLLTAQRLDMGQMKWALSQFDVVDLMDDVFNDNLYMAKEKSLEFENVTEGAFLMKSDYDRIKEVFSNLLQNAVDFTPEDGKITIGATVKEDHVEFFVKDSGVGISPEHQKGLFKKFYQVDTSITRKHGGTGLGLSICKGLIEGLGGKIWVSSMKGKGSTFYFSLPKKTMNDET